MKKTLQDQYLLIKEGKGHKGVFLTEAKRQFPNIVRNSATFEEAAASLKTKNIITENVIGLTAVNSLFEPKKKESYELAYEAFLAEAKKKESEDEKVKAEEKKVSKPVEEDLSKMHDKTDDKNIDNLIFDQVMTGYYAEMKDPKNADKTMQQLKDIVLKNLAKDPIHYTKDGQFGVKDLGYVTEHPGLGEPKEPKGKYKASGYGDLNENIDKFKSDVKAGFTSSPKEKPSEEEIKAKLKQKREAELKRRKEAGEPLEEITLRKVIREMIDAEIEESYQLVNINLKAPKKDREDREPSDKYLTFDKDFEKIERRKGNIIVKDDNKIFITKVLHANLGPKAGNSDLRKHLMDRANLEASVLGGQQVWKIKGAKINSKGNISVFVPVEKSNLKESVEKDLAAINKEAEHEILASKLEKIQSLIDKKQSQIGKLDEDEDMKALTDDKKVKEISKDIKALEKAKAKLEKLMGKSKSNKKEVIDEDEPIEEAIDDAKLDNTNKNLDDISKKVEDISKKSETMFENESNLPQDIINQSVEMFADAGGDQSQIPNIASNFPGLEEDVMEFLEGYDLGLDYDI
jgi:hypothetical protein